MTQVLTVEDVKTAARTYYRRGLLTAQMPDAEDRFCRYHFGKYRCAIGAAMNENTLRAIDEYKETQVKETFVGIANEARIGTLIRVGIIQGDDLKLQEIQDAHDAWVCALNDGFGDDYTEKKRRKFLDLIGF